MITFELRTLRAALILDVRDIFARDRALSGSRPIGTLKFTIPAQMVNGVRRDLAEPLELVTRLNPSGYILFLDRYRVTPTYQARGLLRPGQYVLRTASPVYQPHEMLVDLPTPSRAYTIDLKPGTAYPFPPQTTLIRGTLRGWDGVGLAGASVEVPDLTERFDVGTSGDWVLSFPRTPAAARVSLRFTLPDGAIRHIHDVALEPGRVTAVTQTALHGRVETNNGFGIANARITIEGFPGSVRTNADGAWSVYFDLEQPETAVRVRAALPDGRQMTQDNIPVRPSEGLTVPPFVFR